MTSVTIWQDGEGWTEGIKRRGIAKTYCSLGLSLQIHQIRNQQIVCVVILPCNSTQSWLEIVICHGIKINLILELKETFDLYTVTSIGGVLV